MQNLLVQYEMVIQQIQEIEKLMQELLLKVPNASKLIDIKGIGMVTAVVIVSEIRDKADSKIPDRYKKWLN